jgi:hypothetical protein
MRVVVSTLICVMCFPHQGKVVTVDQLAFFHSDARTNNVPFIANPPLDMRTSVWVFLKIPL